MKAIQMSLFDFVATTDFVDFCLLKGSGFENGKKRILDCAAKNKNVAELSSVISKEYGWGGCSCATYSIDYSPKGWECKNKETGENIKLSWKKVTERILRLIESGQYNEG